MGGNVKLIVKTVNYKNKKILTQYKFAMAQVPYCIQKNPFYLLVRARPIPMK